MVAGFTSLVLANVLCTGSAGPKHALVKSCIATFWAPNLNAAVSRLILIGFKYAQPFLVTAVVSSFGSKGPQAMNKVYGLIAATGLLYLGLTISTVYHQHTMYRMITMLRGTLVTAIYSKIMLIPTKEAKSALTLMSTDIEVISNSLPQLHDTWASLVEVVIAVWLLERQIKYACIVSAAIALGKSNALVFICTLTDEHLFSSLHWGYLRHV